MTIRICDVCGQRPPGAMTTFEVGDRIFDVCGTCEDKPFTVPPIKPITIITQAGLIYV